jgi:hypothetical protein
MQREARILRHTHHHFCSSAKQKKRESGEAPEAENHPRLQAPIQSHRKCSSGNASLHMQCIYARREYWYTHSPSHDKRRLVRKQKFHNLSSRRFWEFPDQIKMIAGHQLMCSHT